jgi:hypothetical protein
MRFFGSPTSDSPEVRFLPLTLPAGVLTLSRMIRGVDIYSVPCRLYLPTYKIKGYSGKLDLPRPHMMFDLGTEMIAGKWN